MTYQNKNEARQKLKDLNRITRSNKPKNIGEKIMRTEFINKKYGIEIVINLKYVKENYVPFLVKESNRSKKLKHKYASNMQLLENYFNGLVKYEERLEESKKKRKNQRIKDKENFLASLVPGESILTCSWGYEQTQVEFYKVLEVKGSKIKIVDVGCVQVEATGPMSCNVMPGKSYDEKNAEWVNVRSNYVKICSSISLHLWDGKPKYKSWYY